MSATQVACPESETLRQFLQGRLVEEEAEGIQRHLAQCSACGDTLQSLEASDTLHELVRAARQPPGTENGEESVIQSLVKRLRELPPPAAADRPSPQPSPQTGEGAGKPCPASAPESLSPDTSSSPASRDERAEGIVRLLRRPQG